MFKLHCNICQKGILKLYNVVVLLNVFLHMRYDNLSLFVFGVVKQNWYLMYVKLIYYTLRWIRSDFKSGLSYIHTILQLSSRIKAS